MSHSLACRQIYGPAILIGLITLYGLLSALLGDGIWDAVSWVALTIPFAVIAWNYSRGKCTPARGRTKE
jgi:hypothetical protein